MKKSTKELIESDQSSEEVVKDLTEERGEFAIYSEVLRKYLTQWEFSTLEEAEQWIKTQNERGTWTPGTVIRQKDGTKWLSNGEITKKADKGWK